MSVQVCGRTCAYVCVCVWMCVHLCGRVRACVRVRVQATGLERASRGASALAPLRVGAVGVCAWCMLVCVHLHLCLCECVRECVVVWVCASVRAHAIENCHAGCYTPIKQARVCIRAWPACAAACCVQAHEGVWISARMRAGGHPPSSHHSCHLAATARAHGFAALAGGAGGAWGGRALQWSQAFPSRTCSICCSNCPPLSPLPLPPPPICCRCHLVVFLLCFCCVILVVFLLAFCCRCSGRDLLCGVQCEFRGGWVSQRLHVRAGVRAGGRGGSKKKKNQKKGCAVCLFLFVSVCMHQTCHAQRARAQSLITPPSGLQGAGHYFKDLDGLGGWGRLGPLPQPERVGRVRDGGWGFGHSPN